MTATPIYGKNHLKIFSRWKAYDIGTKFYCIVLMSVQEEEKKKEDERKRQVLERRYNLPDKPNILVYPNATAKGGKFDCAVMSLSVLLDYRPEDNKEHSFEVSLNFLTPIVI